MATPGKAFSALFGAGDEWQHRMNQNYIKYQKYAKPGTNNYQTALPDDQEQQFRSWVKQNRVPFNPADPVADYDMRGYWKDIASKGQSETAINPNDHQMHFPDTYKTPYHNSFSGESQYALPGGPSWVNDHQLAAPDGSILYDERQEAR